MAETGRLVAFYGAGEPMRIEEYPVPEPEPGAIVVRTTLANVCKLAGTWLILQPQHWVAAVILL